MKLYLSSYRLGNNPEELLRLLGGKKRAAVIINARDFLEPEARAEDLAQELERLQVLDLDFTEVDLRKYFGKTEELKAELESYDLIWVRGGNVFLLRRAFRQSGADTFFAGMLRAKDIVYGGYSAGICILQPHLYGIELVDDPNQLGDGYDAEIIWDCLGVLPYVVAPHYKSDHPESADIDKTVAYYIDSHIPFVALRDGQAIVIDGLSQTFVG